MIKYNTNLIKPSATVAINSLAAEKKGRGEKIFNLAAGEPILDTARAIKKATLKALDENKTLYPPVGGVPELKRLASKWFNANYNGSYKPSETLVTNGGKFGIFLLLQAILKPGDEVLIPAPYWVSYPPIVELFGGRPKILKTSPNTDWKITGQDVLRAKSKRAKILILNNASNPTGTLYSKAELLGILKAAKRAGLFVISDEVYSGLVYNNKKYVSCAELAFIRKQLAVIQSCSKNFAMTGWRVGFVFAPKELIGLLSKLVGQSTSGVTTLSQWASVEALKDARAVTKAVNYTMAKRRDVFANAMLKNFGLKLKKPDSALYYFVKMSDLGLKSSDSVKFCYHALEKANVAMVPGKAFGQEGYVRFAFGAPEKDLRDGVSALVRLCKRL